MKQLPVILVATALLVLVLSAWWTNRLGKVLDERTHEAVTAEVPGLSVPPVGENGDGDESAKETNPKPAPPPGEEERAEPKESSHYTTGPKTRDGIGKYYMGREIAYVMGHQAIDWLERPDRESEEAPTKAIAALGLKPGDVLADIGAGSGYYTFRIAPLVPKGKVVAVDIQQEMLDFLEKKEKELGLTNVETHLGAVDDTKLPANSIDAALMVDAYHEFSHPREMMESIVKALRPGGRVILLEYRAEDPQVPIKRLHKMSQEQAKKEMAAVGLKWRVTHDFLPWQHFMVFEKPVE